MEDITHLLGAVVGDNDADMRLICHKGLMEAFLLSGESLGREARKRLRTKQRGSPLRPR